MHVDGLAIAEEYVAGRSARVVSAAVFTKSMAKTTTKTV